MAYSVINKSFNHLFTNFVRDNLNDKILDPNSVSFQQDDIYIHNSTRVKDTPLLVTEGFAYFKISFVSQLAASWMLLSFSVTTNTRMRMKPEDNEPKLNFGKISDAPLYDIIKPMIKRR